MSYGLYILGATILMFSVSEGVDRLVYGVWFYRYKRNLVVVLVAQIIVLLLLLATKLP